METFTRFKLKLGGKTLANGCYFPGGKVVMVWEGLHRSVAVYDSVRSFFEISVLNHVGRTVEWLDMTPGDWILLTRGEEDE